MTAKALSTTRKIELIEEYKFVNRIINKNLKTCIMHMASQQILLVIYFFRIAQIVIL